MDKLTAIIGDYASCIDDILTQVQVEGFELEDFVQMDHICYRTNSMENYKTKKRELARVATLLKETIVNERPIATFRLAKPIRRGRWRIDAVELPAPKRNNKYAEGLEHVELVLYDDVQTFLAKYKDKDFEMGAANRGINPEVGLKLERYSVKFHLLNLPAVVYLETKLGISEV